jgi:chromosome condensin MukBEF MukE localization factor
MKFVMQEIYLLAELYLRYSASASCGILSQQGIWNRFPSLLQEEKSLKHLFVCVRACAR